MVLILIMVALVFHYIKDKKNLYQHFRMEVINNKVQINFLQFYTNVFVVFMFVIFIATQHSTIEYVLASIVVSGVIVFQNVYFRRGTKRSQDEEEGQGPKTLDDLPQELNISYQERYNHFLEISKNDKIDKGIKEELYGSAFSSIEES